MKGDEAIQERVTELNHSIASVADITDGKEHVEQELCPLILSPASLQDDKEHQLFLEQEFAKECPDCQSNESFLTAAECIHNGVHVSRMEVIVEHTRATTRTMTTTSTKAFQSNLEKEAVSAEVQQEEEKTVVEDEVFMAAKNDETVVSSNLKEVSVEIPKDAKGSEVSLDYESLFNKRGRVLCKLQFMRIFYFYI